MPGSSKQCVFLPEICDDSWLVWSKRLNKVRLRQYTSEGCKVIKELGVPDAERVLNQPDSSFDTLPCYNNIPASKHSFWRLVTQALNVRDGLVEHEEKDRLLAVFKLQCQDPLFNGDMQQLKALFQSWMSRFQNLKRKDGKLNPYDAEDVSERFKPSEGKSWQAAMLEWSRRDGRVQYVNTGNPETNFSFAIMELTLAFPAADNPFFPGSGSRIAPDGLGVRSNGFLTVIEVKGPDDDRDLLGPLLQAVCGALAVVATEAWLCPGLRSQYQRRPAYSNARVPKRSSIGIHVMTAKKKSKGKLETWSEDHEEKCRIILRAFPQLEYIAYSFVMPQRTNNFTQLELDHLVTRQQLGKGRDSPRP